MALDATAMKATATMALRIFFTGLPLLEWLEQRTGVARKDSRPAQDDAPERFAP
jgi:hypothetical protein